MSLNRQKLEWGPPPWPAKLGTIALLGLPIDGTCTQRQFNDAWNGRMRTFNAAYPQASLSDQTKEKIQRDTEDLAHMVIDNNWTFSDVMGRPDGVKFLQSVKTAARTADPQVTDVLREAIFGLIGMVSPGIEEAVRKALGVPMAIPANPPVPTAPSTNALDYAARTAPDFSGGADAVASSRGDLNAARAAVNNEVARLMDKEGMSYNDAHASLANSPLMERLVAASKRDFQANYPGFSKTPPRNS